MDTVDIPFDAIWCPVCSRQIVPKRLSVPVLPPPTPAPAAPTTSHPKTSHQPEPSARLTRGKTGTIRPRAPGLVHGTGRVKPNGTIKRSPTKDAPQDTKSDAIPPSKPAAPVRHRTIIDQTPAPFYCSDECRLADLQSQHSAIDINYHPARRASPSLPPVPPNSVTELPSSQEDSDCSSGASFESRSSMSSPSTSSATARPSAPSPAPKSDPHQDSYNRLSAIYGFAPLPPAAPVTSKVTKTADEPAPRLDGGIMMAARRIQAALCSDKPKRSSWGVPVYSDPEEDNKPIPGWTDGSNAWRASVYGFAPPRDFTRTDPDDAAVRAYGSYVASPHRSRGVHSTLGEGKPATEVKPSASTASLPARVVDASTQELYSQFSASFNRRSESRSSVHRSHNLSSSPTGSARSALGREISLLAPGAEGRLLVPNVKMRRVNSSASSIDGSSSWDSQSGIYSAGSVSGRKRSPLSRQNSDASVDVMETQSEHGRLEIRSMPSVAKPRPTPARTGSYSSETYKYNIMRTAPKREKRIVRKVIDGVERDFEVEVEVEETPKRLFLFGGTRN
ncbi:hypothetical protein K466DRAFT_594698 [Polyporus arcularius HHB13444]|uniref:Uncharacterized protein n=1 Tax=Polyporus arcularius HHB13444 TaxID=1314778 RepID=A0A5C3PTI8_9APHY|nr:hypothetical protein K466DRAFT_594698 [Polyporus arcularius HHB13444]